MSNVYTQSGALGQGKTAATTAGGQSLTTTPATIMMPFRATLMELIPRNYSTAVVVQWTKIPWLYVLKTTDLLATGANMTDYSNAAQDNSTSTVITLSGLDTIAAGHLNALYIGSHTPFVGATLDVQAANSNTSALTVKYRKSDNTWADITATDNTASGGDTMAQDGAVTWTEPSDWIATRLVDHVTGIDPTFGSLMTRQLFWTRWEVSAALDASVTLNSLVALPRLTYAEIPSGLTWEETLVPQSIAGISARTDASTANLIVNVQTRRGGYIPS